MIVLLFYRYKKWRNKQRNRQKNYKNPIEIADIISALLENDYDINMWISLDKDVFINVTEHNADDIIRYLFERYPY